MANEIMNFYDRVRSCLNTTSDVISDDVIAYPEYSGYAEVVVKGRVKDWEELTEGNKAMFESCVVFQTAIYLYPQISQFFIKTEQTTHAKREYRESNIDMLIISLKDRLDEMISELSSNNSSSSGLTFFTVSNQDKRRYTLPCGGDAI